MIFLHFTDFQDTQLRQFDILINENQSGPKLTAYNDTWYLTPTHVHTKSYRADDGKYNVTLAATKASVLPPMINALEIYIRVPYESPTTLPQDCKLAQLSFPFPSIGIGCSLSNIVMTTILLCMLVDAIVAIKTEYGLSRNWMGDPCFPIKYAWDGVKCSNASGNTSRITSLDLSNSSLHGTISKNFTLLTALENLDLSYNKLIGSIPDSLPSLPSLRVLNVSGNQLSDESLLQPVPTHGPTRDPEPDNVSGSQKSYGYNMNKTENRQFTYKELEKFTNNFKKFIGQGGFGPVYYGRLEDDTEVAVKMRSESSSHGLDEFLAEVQSLTKVHHRNLVSLIGYCWEKDHLALVYEYMSQGSLFDHLRGKNGVSQALNWRKRVQVVLEAAQGLDYLHKGCSLPIVHRDVKTNNILLGQNLQAKIADFGLSKTYLSDTQTHISVTPAGTAGYMDPEYYLTGRLSESSDVYSFGVVLLEVATGEAPTVPGRGHVIQRVKQKVATGDVGSIADSRLGSAYDISSMWKVIDTAVMCTADSAAQRPTMATVVVQLKESLALEETREKGSSNRVSRGSDIEAMASTLGPFAR
ncbi:putative LRR receptor-like serine/threonine-protein kinase [Zea mays]|uniref:non-specific serine/threonine protein kinase n=1 Tax=Zea mays TaxID=4577 RepID=A0A1D6I2N0_MAIZE|nr:putative LRR receptor-like serine/threonine-protein kinase [Zea mays]ONM54432.1 putative LRR receptor-like serine/threonine-protein kinase [Zea mays]